MLLDLEIRSYSTQQLRLKRKTMASMMKKAEAETEAKSGKVFRCGFCDAPCGDVIEMWKAKVVCGQIGNRVPSKKYCSMACSYAWIRDSERPSIQLEISNAELDLEHTINGMREAIPRINPIKDGLATLEKDFEELGPDGFMEMLTGQKMGCEGESIKDVKKRAREILTHNLAIEEIQCCLARECKAFIKFKKALLSRQPRAVLEVLQKQLLDTYGEQLENHMTTQNEKKTYFYATRIKVEQGDEIINSFCRN